LVAQCGGAGNIDAFRRLAEAVAQRPPYAEYMAGMRPPWHYATPEATEQRLRAAGFGEIQCWLEDKLTLPADARGFAQTVLLNYHLDHLRKTAPPSAAAQLAADFTDEVLAQAGDPLELHYVRLNIEATTA
jgi:trans-aconitate 2-methyltransferase